MGPTSTSTPRRTVVQSRSFVRFLFVFYSPDVSQTRPTASLRHLLYLSLRARALYGRYIGVVRGAFDEDEKTDEKDELSKGGGI